MRYLLSVTQPVYGSQASYLAYQFAQALLQAGHTIDQVFFSVGSNKWQYICLPR